MFGPKGSRFSLYNIQNGLFRNMHLSKPKCSFKIFQTIKIIEKEINVWKRVQRVCTKGICKITYVSHSYPVQDKFTEFLYAGIATNFIHCKTPTRKKIRMLKIEQKVLGEWNSENFPRIWPWVDIFANAASHKDRFSIIFTFIQIFMQCLFHLQVVSEAAENKWKTK
jgi:hypothetical protein